MSRPCPHGLCVLDAGHDSECEEPELGKGHHPSFTPRVRRAFCASLRDLGWTYDEAAALCESMDQPRPSRMPQRRRNRLIVWLAGKPEPASTWREAQRASARRAA